MRSPAFLYIPFCEHTVTLNSGDLAYPDYLAYSLRSYALVLCDYRFHPFRKAHQSHWCNEACVFTLAHYGLLARYQRTRIQTSRFISSRGNCLFHSLPPKQSIGGLEFLQLIYKSLVAYRNTRNIPVIRRGKHEIKIFCPLISKIFTNYKYLL
jgi:hypothetical protein